MKHRLLLLLLFVFTAVMTGWAQNSAMPSYTVKGVLLDSLTQDGEPYATIKITKKGAPDKAVKMAVTGANGTNGKTNCSIFKKHFVPSSPLLTQNKMCILLQKIEATYSVASIFALNLRKRSTVG